MRPPKSLYVHHNGVCRVGNSEDKKKNGIEIVLRFVDYLYGITEFYFNISLLSFEDWCQNVSKSMTG